MWTKSCVRPANNWTKAHEHLWNAAWDMILHKSEFMSTEKQRNQHAA
jgi:hypothetical protein